jgi:hypothetical protein
MNPFPRDYVSLRIRGTAKNKAFFAASFWGFFLGLFRAITGGRIVAEIRFPIPPMPPVSSSLTRRVPSNSGLSHARMCPRTASFIPHIARHHQQCQSEPEPWTRHDVDERLIRRACLEAPSL